MTPCLNLSPAISRTTSFFTELSLRSSFFSLFDLAFKAVVFNTSRLVWRCTPSYSVVQECVRKVSTDQDGRDQTDLRRGVFSARKEIKIHIAIYMTAYEALTSIYMDSP